MSNRGEHKMWKYLAPKLKPYGHFERIESHETAIGTPDVEYCIGGYTNRIELKFSDSEKKGLRLRPSQAGWFRKRVKAGGQPWLLAQALVRKKRGYVLVAGSDVPALVHTTRIDAWLEAGLMVWEDKIDVEELIQFLSTYLIVESPVSSGAEETDSSGLILPSHLQKP
jgi:hypothetical protein